MGVMSVSPIAKLVARKINVNRDDDQLIPDVTKPATEVAHQSFAIHHICDGPLLSRPLDFNHAQSTIHNLFFWDDSTQ